MILETIKSYITNLPDKRFTQVFTDYIKEVQDNNLSIEVGRLTNTGTLNPRYVDSIISTDLQEVQT